MLFVICTIVRLFGELRKKKKRGTYTPNKRSEVRPSHHQVSTTDEVKSQRNAGGGSKSCMSVFAFFDSVRRASLLFFTTVFISYFWVKHSPFFLFFFSLLLALRRFECPSFVLNCATHVLRYSMVFFFYLASFLVSPFAFLSCSVFTFLFPCSEPEKVDL